MPRSAALLLFALTSAAAAASEPTVESLKFDVSGARQPRLAAGPGGRVHCVFAAGDAVFHAASADGGRTFAAPKKVAALPGLMLGMRRGPRVAVAGDAVVVSAIGHREGDLVAWRSADAGKTWAGPVRVNDAGEACREGLHDTAASEDGTFGSAWLDLRNGKTELWAAFSADGGATWGENRLVYRSPGGSVCECCHPTLSASGDGWAVLFRNSVGGNRDMYVARRPTAGAGPAEAERLGGESWRLPACPMDGGDFDLIRSGWAVWRRGETCYATDLSGDPAAERRLGRGEQPAVAVTPAGPAYAWVAGRPGDLMVVTPGGAEPAKVAMNASDPCLVTAADGGLVLAWEEGTGENAHVRVMRLAVR